MLVTKGVRLIALCILVFAAACAPLPDPWTGPPVGITHTESADVTTWSPGLTPNLRISPQLMRACRPRFGEVSVGAPTWFEPAGLAPEDESLLLQLARCVEQGAFEGHVLILVRRDDGERIERARRYLIEHGLPPQQIETRDVDARVDRPRDGRIGVYVTTG